MNQRLLDTLAMNKKWGSECLVSRKLSRWRTVLQLNYFNASQHMLHLTAFAHFDFFNPDIWKNKLEIGGDVRNNVLVKLLKVPKDFKTKNMSKCN